MKEAVEHSNFALGRRWPSIYALIINLPSRFNMPNEKEMWVGLQNAVSRRDIFWIFFYADQLATVWAHKRAAETLQELPIVD